jgi:hypothetical protein
MPAVSTATSGSVDGIEVTDDHLTVVMTEAV